MLLRAEQPVVVVVVALVADADSGLAVGFGLVVETMTTEAADGDVDGVDNAGGISVVAAAAVVFVCLPWWTSSLFL